MIEPVVTIRGIDVPALEGWFAQNVRGSRAPLRIQLIAGGHSNLTYRVDDASGSTFALRRPPTGDLPRGAHDVAREHRILAALKETAVPVPPVEALCSDTAVIGAPFYVMGWVDGRIVDNEAAVVRLLPTIESRQQAAFTLIEGLAALHAVDVNSVGLGDLGPHEHYLSRQLERMRKVWEKTKTRDLPIIESLHARLVASQPAQRHTGVVHSDFRFGNIMFDPDGRLLAVLDWELCAIGDVLVDLGFLLCNWDLPLDPWESVWMRSPPTRAGGFPNREEMCARYAQLTGFDVECIDYYQAFCYWRIAVIAEGMKRRYESGAMGDQSEDSALLDRRVRARAELADQFLARFGS